MLMLLAAAGPAAGAEERLAVPGLAGPVEILIDRWGVPHVFAAKFYDAFFAQGFVTARDRLWQIDTMRRRQLGRLAAVLGPALIPYDHAARLFLYRSDPAAAWRAFDPRIHMIARAYVAGINAYIRLTEERPQLLPLEFGLLGYRPERWDADDLVRMRSGAAGGGIEGQVRRARLACLGALEADQLRSPLEPPWHSKVPEGLEPCALAGEDVALYRMLSAALPFEPGRPGAAEGAAEGSNAWAIAPGRTDTGRAILANDPHLPIGIPSARYLLALEAPGFAAAGASIPGMPGIANGHNARVAFGRTDFPLAREDLYVLETKSDDPEAYRYRGRWEHFETVAEEIAVKGAPPAQLTLHFSALGPVISESPGERRALAVRATWMAPSAAPALSALGYNLAHDWPSFTAALESYPTGTGFTYADLDGHIGWHAAGWAPVRPHHDGLLPVPAAGHYDWAGITPVDELPSIFDPPGGRLANANQMSLPEGYPYAARKLGFEWSPPFRETRILDVLGRAERFSLGDSAALQHDTWSEPAERLIPLLEHVIAETRRLRESITLLRGWDRRVEAPSAAAALFELWTAALGRASASALVPAPLRTLIPYVDRRVLLAALERPDARFGPDPAAGRDALLAATLDQARDDLEKLQGADPAAWSWGRLHTVDLVHPLAALMPRSVRVATSVVGGTSGGDGTTVMARWWRNPWDANVTGGAAFSMVLDVGSWDDSLVINAPGQSGNPASPHYRDLYEPWLNGRMFPLLVSRAKVEAAAERRIRLMPRR